MDILAVVTDPEEKSHVFGGLPTGFGKSLYQMLVSLLSPAGMKTVLINTTIHNRNYFLRIAFLISLGYFCIFLFVQAPLQL